MSPGAGLARHLLICACLVGMAAAARAHEGDNLLRVGLTPAYYAVGPVVEYLEDPEHRYEVQAAARAYADGLFNPTPQNGDLNFGYNSAALWLAFKVRAEADAPRDWFLEVAFPSIDHLEVYVPGPKGPQKLEAGDLRPFAERPIEHRNFVFPLTLKAGETQTVFIRIASQGSLTVPLRLWQPRAFAAAEQWNYSAFALYFGMLFALFLYNLLLYLSLRDRVFLAYVTFVAFMALGNASYNGFGNQFLWPHWPAWGNIALPSCMAAAGFFGAVFTRLFLNTRTVSRTFDLLVCINAVAFAFVALSPLFLPYRFAAIATSLVAVTFSATAVAAGGYCLYRRQPGARYFLLAWTLLLVGVGVLGMRNLSWVPTNWFTSNAMLIGSAMEMLLLSFALADRINLLRREKDAAQAAALQSNRQMVEALQRSEHELEERVKERTRELADANARLTESEQQLQHMVYHDPLTGVANRVLLYDRVTHALASSSRHGSLLAVLMIDLDGFKGVNDRYGHDVGDQLLSTVANRLRAAVRDADTVARFGGDEFVIALETIHHLQDAVLVSTKLLAELQRPFALGDRELNISASIGIALFPDHGADANTLIKQADEAMYRAKQSGRNAYRLAGA
jgi:two-component system, sensor histidine kinase LadS